MMAKRTGGSFVPFSLCCCIVLFAFLMDAARADTSNSSSIVSSDGQTGDDTETTVEKGMKPFFDMVKTFLGVVQPQKLTEQTWLNFSDIYTDGKLQTEQFENWQDWATYLIGFMVCAAVGVLFFIVMPIIGIIFCCCRCCGKCGGRPKPHDPKHAGCKRKSYCTLLLLLNTVTLAGVVCAFLSNELVYQKLRNEGNVGPVGKLTATLDHVDGFANTTVDEIEVAILDKFIETKDRIINDVRETANRAVDEVLSNLNATSLLDQTKTLSKVVNKTRDELSNVATTLSTLSLHGSWLAANLTEIVTVVKNVCAASTGGGQAGCGNFQEDKYRVSANFSNLDDLSREAQNVSNSVNLTQYITEAEDAIDQTKNSTTQSVDDGIKRAAASVDDVQNQIESGIGELKSEVKNSVTDRTDSLRSDLLKVQDDISEYSKYWWYGGLGVSCVLLLVVLLYYVGVLFGLCGERPGLGAQCCNTGTGANFLMAGVGVTFLLAWLVMLVCVLLFVTGGPLYTEVCRYFVDHDPQELKPFNEAVTQAVDLKKGLFDGKDVNLDIISILDGCKDNRPIYNVMRLNHMVNLTQYTDLTPLERELDRLKNDTFNIPNITIVTPRLRQSVSDFAASGLDSVNFDRYFEEVNKNLTVGDLNVMAENLRNIARQGSAGSTLRTELEKRADDLDQLQSTLVLSMRRAVVSLNTSLTYLHDQVQTQIRAATDVLLNGLQTAQSNFNDKKDELVRTQLDTVIDRVIGVAEAFVQDMLRDVDENIGKCRPVFDGFYSASDAVCVVVLEPLNGFWFSVGWCLFFFIPCLIFAVKLAGLYRREHDEKDFDDPNYILYGGGNQDTIPLTSVDRGHPSAYPGHGSGMANSAYHRDSYLGPIDKYAPPPYGAPPNGMGSAVSNGSRGGPSYGLSRKEYQY